MAGSPRAVRSSRRFCERTSSRGLSIRTVAAPTRIASQEARTGRPGRSRRRWTARGAVATRCRGSRRSTCHSSTGCTGGQAWAACSRSGGFVRCGKSCPTEPSHHQHGSARKAGHEHHDAVHDRGRDPLLRAQADGAERPRRHPLAWAPASSARQHHGHHHEQGYRDHLRRCDRVAGSSCRDQEADRVAGDDERRREHDPRATRPG